MSEEFRFDGDQPDDFFNEDFEQSPQNEDNTEKEVKVAGVFEHRNEENDSLTEFVVLLKDEVGRTVLIVIGRFEAMAISLAYDGQCADRPLTHDLMYNTITKMGGVITKILIDDLWNNTYYAKIAISYSGKEIVLDSRPSDAIALALRAKAHIYMVESVLQKAALKEE